jgi:DNA adenine methylase
MQPFLPWPGSKAKCSAQILSEFPVVFESYYEPFLGSGAVFFATNNNTGPKFAFNRVYLSDTNANLINCWRAVKRRPEHVKQMLLHCVTRNSLEFYEQMRTQLENPAVFLYVMRAAFSSMYRENQKKEFNVPWRKQDFLFAGKTMSHDTEQIDLCSRYMNVRDVDISVAHWEIAVQYAKAGDVVYFDPPYLPYTETGFVNYQSGGFNEDNHVFLRNIAKALGDKGVYVYLSNSDVPASRRIYGDPVKLISVVNAVKSTATTKGTRSEGLWKWGPPVPLRVKPPVIEDDIEDDFDADAEES